MGRGRAASGARPLAFEYDDLEEPHAARNKEIRKAHPELLRGLRSVDYTTIAYVLFAVVVQVGCAYLATRDNVQWWQFVLLAYTIGGMCNHSMTLAMHEISHDLAGRGALGKAVGMLASMPLGVAAFATFKRYHLEHHKYQGEDGVDTDVPTAIEGEIVGTNPVLKTVWMLCQPAFYALRPMFTVNKAPSALEGLNWLVQLSFDAFVWWLCGSGWRGLLGPGYLFASTLLSMGLHPMAGHFVAEHYSFVRGQETYSYYGPLNWFSFYVGYHNEHHDACNVPGSRLRELRDGASEQYEHLPVHHSWVKVIWKYITSPLVSPFSRIRRHTLSDEDVAAIQAD